MVREIIELTNNNIPSITITTTPALSTNATVVVLGYHQFDSPVRTPYSINTTNFFQQMQFLKDNAWTPISLDELINFLKGKIPLPEKSVLITIDDGYRSVYLHAYPILKQFKYPWVFFCYTDFVNFGPQSVTWEQLKEMQHNGCTVQSHTKSHPKLTHRNGKSEEQYEAWLKQELAYSKFLLEKKLGTPVYALAYSYGDWDAHVQQRALQYGYEALFTVYGTITKQSTPLNRIGRIIITKENESLFSHYLRSPTVKVLMTNTPPATNTIPSPTSSDPLH
ncbi:MAG: polysaccharide deacetylase family protein [Verrucomicrobiae bacterium]|nr:polysaccharide deacetylase family protein [Verrucomicrobiae bacterium]